MALLARTNKLTQQVGEQRLPELHEGAQEAGVGVGGQAGVGVRLRGALAQLVGGAPRPHGGGVAARGGRVVVYPGRALVARLSEKKRKCRQQNTINCQS